MESLEPKLLLAVGPQLVGINPNQGGLLNDGDVRNIAPQELTFSFDENQVLDPATLDGIRVTRLSDGQPIQPGFVGLGETSNEVILRFAEGLVDDSYRIDVIGRGDDALRNVSGDAFNDGVTESIAFELNLAPLVTAIVPQPISRSATGGLQQARNQIHVYFNDDDLLPASAENPEFYHLIHTADTVTNRDDTVHLPTDVAYDATRDLVTLTFETDLAQLPTGPGTYRLRVGTAQSIPGAPIEVDATVTDVGATFDSALDLGVLGREDQIVSSSIDTTPYPLNFPGQPGEPGRPFPLIQPDEADGITQLEYNFQPTITVDGRLVTTVEEAPEEDLQQLDEEQLPASVRDALAAVNSPLRQTATVQLVDPGNRWRIRDGANWFNLKLQGSTLLIIRGTNFSNLITAEQKERAREIVDLLTSITGVQFVETPDRGITVGTANIPLPLVNPDPGLYPKVVAVPFTFQDDAFGAGWFNEALRQMISQLDDEFSAPPDPLFFAEDPTRDFSFVTPIYIDPTFPNPPVINPTQEEQLFPRNSSQVNLNVAHRPDANDVDVYQFQLTRAGELTAETIAERLATGLDSKLRLYRQEGARPALIAQNDDYFGRDALIDWELEPGTYYVTVSSTGLEYDPLVENGTGGLTQGDYDLRLSFHPTVANSLVDSTGRGLDGDADGISGGVYNYWFQARDLTETIFVDKAATGAGLDGSLSDPFTNIVTALEAAQPGNIVRIVGNGGADGDLSTLEDNLAYEIGSGRFGVLSDGGDMVLPQGVTAMIDAGAIFKVLQSSIQVGSSSVAIDLSGSALQVLGTPEHSVVFTSFDDESIGVDTNPLPTTPDPGDWGGILIRNDVDRAEGRFDYEQIGAFPNYINHADMRFGGGRVAVASVEQVVTPVQMIDARPEVSFNRITFSADAALSVNPDSFEETRFHAIDSLGQMYQETPFTPGYARFGPDIHRNFLIDNTINGLFVRIGTMPNRRLERMTVTGRWDDIDVVHVVKENLIIEGESGGPLVNADGGRTARVQAGLKIDRGTVVKLDGARVEATLGTHVLAEGDEGQSIIFTSLLDDRFGAGGTFNTSNDAQTADRDPSAGDWAGIYMAPASRLSLDHAVVAYGGGLARVEGSFAGFNAIEVHQADARITNSVIEFSDQGRGGQADLDRVGRMDNAKGAIFLRGSQAIIVSNIIRGTEGRETPAISTDTSSLSHQLRTDTGRSTGLVDRFRDFRDNQGSLIRLNRLADNSLNGMIVRGGTVTTEVVMDDTDIVHIVLEPIQISNIQTFGGVRLESSVTESLVIKFAGNRAGFIGSGVGTATLDRVGGILHVMGQPGHPVVMTSLYDDTVGAGFDPQGQPLNVTSSFNRPLPTQPPASFQVDLNYGPLIRDLPKFREAAELAVRIWESIIEDPVRVTIDVEFGDLEIGTLGVTSNVAAAIDFNDVVSRIAADAGDRAHESIARLLPEFEQFSEDVIVPDDPANPFTISPSMTVARANAKALGFSESFLPVTVSAYDPTEALDATITMNDDFEIWDHDRTDGILPTLFDFAGVMIHEIGHALGFVSAVDDVDAGLADPTVSRMLGVTPLDMFRLSPGKGQEDFENAPRNLNPRQEHVFFDGGLFDPVTPSGFPAIGIPNLTVGDVPLSTGEQFGDGAQASHFKDAILLGGLELGMMDPTGAPGREVTLTQVDRQSFDLIGWDIVGGPIAGDWRGITMETLAHDGNVGIHLERESTESSEIGNALPSTAEFLGALAPDQKSGDENNRLGFTVHGLLNGVRDVDVYSFDAVAGTHVWIDMDRTTATLDSVIELIDGNGRVLARSDNSLEELNGESDIVKAPGVFATTLPLSPFGGTDFWTTNVLDPGFRIVLPGASGNTNTYHLRVRSSSDRMDVMSAGQSSGVYQLQLRLREADEHAGSTVQFASIGYAVDGVRVRGLPGSSPLTGTVREDGSLNDDVPIQTFDQFDMLSPDPPRSGVAEDVQAFGYVDLVRDPLRLTADPAGYFYARSTDPYETEFQGPQLVGDISRTRAGAITISGNLDNLLPDVFSFELIQTPDKDLLFTQDATTGEFVVPDIDWYQFEVNQPTTLAFDIDYADGIAGPDASIFVYEAFYRFAGVNEELVSARLIYSSLNGRDNDDQAAPLKGANFDDLGRGSVTGGDPFLGPVPISPTTFPGRFLVAVTAGLRPVDFRQFTVPVPPADPNLDLTAGRNRIEAVPIPHNPFVRLEPVETVTRVLEDDFEGLEPPATKAVPHHLGDVPLFISSTDGSSSTFALVDPLTGSSGGNVGILGRPIGDFDLRQEDFNFYAYTLGNNDANSGNYLLINPEDATFVSVEEDRQAVGGGQAAALTDDEIETQEPDPNNPGGTVQSDTGVQFEAFAFFNDAIGYAIGHRPDLGVENILYQFSVPRGNALGAEVDDAALVDPPHTNIESRGVIDVTLDSGLDDTILSILTGVTVDGQLQIPDGESFQLASGTTFEFNLGPELILDLDHLDGRHFVDGDRFTVNGVEYEVDTGSVLEVFEQELADGDTFTLTNDNLLNPRTTTFEIDRDGDGVVEGNVPVAIEPGADLATAVDAITSAINDSDAEVEAVAFASRISLLGESRLVGASSSNPDAILVHGNPGTTNGLRVPLEESYNGRQVGAVFGALFGSQVSVLRDRIVFPGATADFSELASRGIIQPSDADSSVSAESIAIDLLPSDTLDTVAQKAADAINDNDGQASLNQWQVIVDGDTFVPEVNSSILSVGGSNPGGRITGMQFVGSRLYAVTDAGGLYEITNFSAPSGAAADFIETSTELAGAQFSGLTLGPPSIEGRSYADVFFATTSAGEIHAFDTTGLPQPVFVDGQTSVSTGIGGANGLLFSPQDENLWHITGRKGPDPGHGELDDFGNRLDLGLSLHFGDSNPDLTENRNYNFPGGSHGTFVTDSFSLEGYTAKDEPVLYFNYFLTSDTSSGGQDAFRVYATDETAPVGQGRGEWLLLADNDPLALFDPAIEPLFDNTWEDQPALYPGDPIAAMNPAERILRRNGLRDPYTQNRSNLDAEGQPQDTPPFPIPSEEASIWRQARIDLSPFAGSGRVKLRFDFSSAGTLGIGDPNTGGSELRAVAGSLIRDGDQFVIDDDVVFEFDKGLTLDVPAAAAIAEGETLVLTDPVNNRLALQFVRSEPTSKSLLITDAQLTEGAQFDLVFEETVHSFPFDPEDVNTDPAATAENIANAINDLQLPFTAAAEGNQVRLSDPNVQLASQTPVVTEVHVLLIDDTLPASDVAQLVDEAINSAGQGMSSLILTRSLNLQGVAEVDTDGGSRFRVSGRPGQADPTDEEVRLIPIHALMTADEVATQVSIAVAEAFAGGEVFTVKTFENVVLIHGHTVSDPGPLGLADQLPGDDPNHLYDPLRGQENQFQYVIIDQGGGGQQIIPFDEAGQVNFNVPYEGVYVDDLIIGFAARGEKVVNHRISSIDIAGLFPVDDTDDRTRILRPQTQRRQGTDFDQIFNDINGLPPLLPDEDPMMGDGIYDGLESPMLVDRSHFVPEPPAFELDPNWSGTATGQYQLQIRVASDATATRLATGDLLDPRERLSESVTLFAPAGNELVDGFTVGLTDGIESVTLEYEDLEVGNGVAPGNVAIEFHSGHSAAEVAETIRDLINSSLVTLDITASASDGTVFGASDHNAIQIHGVVFPDPNSFIGFEVSQASESSNLQERQGQIVIDSNTITHSQMFGVVTEDGFRAVPNPLIYDPEGLLVHAPAQIGDFSSALGSARDLVTANLQNQIPNAVISNNVIARGGAGGIHASGDPGGYLITAPLGGDAFQTEVWDNYPFIFAITDHAGRTVQFEFDTDGTLNSVTPTVPVTITTTVDCPYNDRACMPRTDAAIDPNMTTILARTIQGSPLDVTVWMGDPLLAPTQPLFIEGAAEVVGIAAGRSLDELLLVDWFTPWYDQVLPLRTFSRIVNNTIVGRGGRLTDNERITVPVLNPGPGQQPVKNITINDFRDAGILIDDFAFPTVLNNITVNLEAGIRADNSSNDSVIGATLYQANIESTDNINIGDFPIELTAGAPLFVDIDSDNFYLAAGSLAIDSSVDSLEDRPRLVSLKEPVGIARSNILAPDRDALGQLREDDPSVETPRGLGQNVFKDRGAIDRVDFLGPSVRILNPRDNDSEGVDKDSAETRISLEGRVLTNFTIQFVDSFRVGDPREGTGIDPASVSPESISVTRDGALLQNEIDYTFSFDATNSQIRLTPIAGVWPNGSNYVIRLADDIRDIAGNLLRPNRQTGETIFTISTVIGSDYGDAPAPYPTLLADGGPRHTLVADFFLGAGATADQDGQPNANAAGDGQDDGVNLPDVLQRNASNSISVLATANGILDAWIDLNGDGDWNDSGEKVFDSVALTAGVNQLSIDIPNDAVAGDTFARFRFSSSGGLSPTGSAADGEVEDYRVTIDPGNVWQNLVNRYDTNNDGSVSPIDVLRIIQESNTRRASDPFTSELFNPPIEPNTPEVIGFVDVNGDGFVTALDALSVIQILNGATAPSAAGEPDLGDVAAALSPEPITVEPRGEAVGHPQLVPTPAPPQDEAPAVVVVRDDLDEVITGLASDRSKDGSGAIDEALAEVDWLHGDLDG